MVFSEDAEITDLVVVQETSADMQLVTEAQAQIVEIVSSHYENAMLEAGQYLIAAFFGNDYERAKAGKPVKDQSLRQMILQMKANDPKAPSRSWVYNAVRLAVEQKELADFHTYGQLDHSKKVLLLPVHDLDQKKELIEEAVSEGYSARKLKERVQEVREKQTPASGSDDSVSSVLRKAVSKPDVIFNDENKDLLKVSTLRKLRPSSVSKLRAKAYGQTIKIENDIAVLKEKIESQKNFLKAYESLIEKLKKIEEEKGTVTEVESEE